MHLDILFCTPEHGSDQLSIITKEGSKIVKLYYPGGRGCCVKGWYIVIMTKEGSTKIVNDHCAGGSYATIYVT